MAELLTIKRLSYRLNKQESAIIKDIDSDKDFPVHYIDGEPMFYLHEVLVYLKNKNQPAGRLKPRAMVMTAKIKKVLRNINAGLKLVRIGDDNDLLNEGFQFRNIQENVLYKEVVNESHVLFLMDGDFLKCVDGDYVITNSGLKKIGVKIKKEKVK